MEVGFYTDYRYISLEVLPVAAYTTMLFFTQYFE